MKTTLAAAVLAAAAAPLAWATPVAVPAKEVVGAIPTVNQGLATGLTAVVVFTVTAIFLHLVVWPKISKGLDDREKKIKNAIDEAEMARQQAKDALEEYQKSLENARAEAARMLESARTQQQALSAELKSKAEADVAALRERARKDIEAAKKAAVAEVYEQAANLSTAIAGKILKRSINADDHRQIVQDSIAQMQGQMQGSRN